MSRVSRCLCGDGPKRPVWPVAAVGGLLVASVFYAAIVPVVVETPPAHHPDATFRAAESYGARPRSPQWPRVRAEHLRHEPACIVCGHTGEGLEVHHVEPVRVRPDLELSPSNLCTVCGMNGRCQAHYWLCHAGQWRGHNPHVREDAALMRGRWKESERLARER